MVSTVSLTDALALPPLPPPPPPKNLDFLWKQCNLNDHHAVGHVGKWAMCASLASCWIISYLHNRCNLQRSLFLYDNGNNNGDYSYCFCSCSCCSLCACLFSAVDSVTIVQVVILIHSLILRAILSAHIFFHDYYYLFILDNLPEFHYDPHQYDWYPSRCKLIPEQQWRRYDECCNYPLPPRASTGQQRRRRCYLPHRLIPVDNGAELLR